MTRLIDYLRNLIAVLATPTTANDPLAGLSQRELADLPPLHPRGR